MSLKSLFLVFSASVVLTGCVTTDERSSGVHPIGDRNGLTHIVGDYCLDGVTDSERDRMKMRPREFYDDFEVMNPPNETWGRWRANFRDFDSESLKGREGDGCRSQNPGYASKRHVRPSKTGGDSKRSAWHIIDN